VNLDKLTYAGNLDNLKEAGKFKNYSFIKGDILDSDLVDEIFRKFSIKHVINFAAESHVDRSIMGSEIFFSTNVMGTNVLLETARRYDIERFIQISTDEVYGSLGDKGVFTEDSPLSPNSPYSASKASAELMALAFQRTFDLPVIITRGTNNYGPYQFPEKLIPLMIINALGNKKLPVYGDGMNVRDWIYVVDHNNAVELIWEKGNLGEVYNIGAGQEMKNIDVVKIILQHLKKSEDLIEYVNDRPGHDRRYALDSGKLNTDLGWKPQYIFEEAITDTIDWYQSNKSWWKHILTGEYQEYYKI
jgi:dTDP-glucose 4,6-dehydratase